MAVIEISKSNSITINHPGAFAMLALAKTSLYKNAAHVVEAIAYGDDTPRGTML